MFEEVRKKASDVFSYAAIEEVKFENAMSQNGYERKTTFYSDLSIAEWYGKDGVMETYNNVMEEWMGDVEYITEFIMSLNVKCWEFYDCGLNDESEFYGDLYYTARDKFYEHYKDDEDARDYFFRMTD